MNKDNGISIRMTVLEERTARTGSKREVSPHETHTHKRTTYTLWDLDTKRQG